MEKGTYWKFNNALLQNNDYIILINTIIDQCVLQYVATPHNRESVSTIPHGDLHFTIDADLFWETLLLMIRGETIQFSCRLKNENASREKTLLYEIAQLEMEVQENTYAILHEKKTELEELRKIYMQGALIRSRGQWVEWGEKPSAFF